MLTMVLFLVYPLVRLNLLAPLFLWSAADWSLANFLLKVIQWVLPWVVGIFLTANLIVKLQVFDAKARQELEPWIVSFFSSMVWIFALGRTGSSSNYTLELLSTLAVCVAVANHKFERHFLFNLHIVVMLIYCIIMSTAYIVNTIPQTRRELDIVRSTITKSMDGPVLSEYTWHTTVLQRPPLIIPFLSHQLARKKLWDPSPLVDQLAHKTIRWIILGFPLSSQPKFGHSDRWLPVILDTARANYKLAVSQDDLYIYEPL